jgi:hypothetical protein
MGRVELRLVFFKKKIIFFNSENKISFNILQAALIHLQSQGTFKLEKISLKIL